MSTNTATASRDRVPWTDLAWVTGRQHRLLLVGTGAAVLTGALLMAAIGLLVASRGTDRLSVLTFDSLSDPANLLVSSLPLYGGVVAVFWAAPLLSKEYEQRTHLLVWSQDVSAARWLAGKTLVLGTVAVAYALVLGAAGAFMIRQLDGNTRYYPSRFDTPFFGTVPLVQVGYALCGFALGLAISAITRRTVLSMGLTFGVFLVLRVFVAAFLRPYYQTPVRVTTPVGAQRSATNPTPGWVDGSLTVDAGYLDAAGNPIDYLQACQGDGNVAVEDPDTCLRRSGVVSDYIDYQPANRIGTFHLIEFGVFTALAIMLAVITWRVARRVTRL